MELKIGGKEYLLKFGILFNRKLDEAYTQNIDGMEFGMGVEAVYVYLSTENIDGIFNTIRSATAHLKSVPSDADLETYIEERAIADKGLSKLSKELLEGMKESPFFSSKLKNMESLNKKAQAQANKN